MKDTRLVIDLETKNAFEDVGGRNQLHKLGVSLVGVYDYASGDYRCYEEGDIGRLQNRLIDCALLIGFNHVHFDLPALQPYLSIDVAKIPTFDIMLDVAALIGHRVGLDAIARATLGVGKFGTGLDAIRYYREGRMEELKTYCLKDVEITHQIYEFGLKNKKIHYASRFGHDAKELKVNWSAFNKGHALAAIHTKPVEAAQYKLF